MEATHPLALLGSWRAGGGRNTSLSPPEELEGWRAGGGRGRNIFLCPPQELGAGGLGVEGLPPLALLRSSRTGVGRNTSHSPSRELELEMEGWGEGGRNTSLNPPQELEGWDGRITSLSPLQELEGWGGRNTSLSPPRELEGLGWAHSYGSPPL